MSEPLEIERQTFECLKPDLLASEGKFAVIKGESLLGIYATYEDALTIGFEKCGLTPFLVKKILILEPVNHFSRALAAA